MARAGGNADRQMLDIGKKIICKEGCSALRIREVADRAGVNLGMFHYHFKSKRRFKQLLLQDIYEDFFGNLLSASKEGKNAQLQLKNMLYAMGCFVRDRREFYFAVLRDVVNDDREVTSFIRKNFPRHAGVLSDLIVRCQKEGTMRDLPVPQIISILMTNLNIPTLIGYAISRHQTMPISSLMISDEAISVRIDIVLKGLRP